MKTLADVTAKYLTDEWQAATRTFEVVEPASGKVLANVADCDAQTARRAADVAWGAFEKWRATSAFERSDVLTRWHDLIIENTEALATTMTREMGKPLKESRGEVKYAAGFVRWYAEEAKRVYGDLFPAQDPSKRLLAVPQPVGPAFAITPWNFPLAMVTRKAAPALAAGCTFVLKPAEQSPVSALLLADLWLAAGGPAGTLQVLPTSDPAPLSTVLIEDPRIRKLTFTGSTEVGRILYAQAAATVKRISLELGGHAPFLVFADADLDDAVAQVMASKFRNAGQTCVCANRIYVHSSVVEEFTERYAAAAARLVVGDPLDAATDVGPLVDAQAVAKVERHVAEAVGGGARIVTGGKRLDGLYHAPTVLAGVRRDALLMREETFGPVAPIAAFETEDEAVRLANDTPFGLAAYLYTRDLGRAFRVSEALEYGIVGVNDGVPSAPYAPFGGVKQSGIGREGGPWGIHEYLSVKYVAMGLGRA
ncbi:MAG: NAD-dependent succinate-semialdehyde dehydrogenase [Trueperaceae bacterium]|nr:NAD-dependent succinate-semialdehyde dehydrogenase [Trueperaceae bacterium]MCO5172601.1 NAD-dependent succinate-semialdehyde dehydrogenase [Trueperaceae bacterium]MCW5819148.1 NAD-dependent succinate-semialdehyde dehydrogenase [Trueperaceae bacterium]